MAASDAARASLTGGARDAARPLAGPAGVARFSCALATKDDDPAIRRLLCDQIMPGVIRMSFEREPDASLAGSIEGDVHQTLVTRDPATGRLLATAARSVRDAFVNGEPARLGYLGQLRIDRSCRRVRAVLADGFEVCRALHEKDDARVYLASLVADHSVARRLLIRPAFGAAPAFVPVDTLTTFAIQVGRHARAVLGGGMRIESGSASWLEEIAACLQRNGSRFQFAPRWTLDDLQSRSRTRGLTPEDFAIAVSHGRVVGCTALWDQRAFKQVRIRGYAQGLARMRPFVNLASRAFGRPPLPAVGAVLRSAFLSHVAVDDDRRDVFMALVATQRRRAVLAGIDYLVVGFAERHPLHEAARSVRHHAYRSQLYAAYWPDGERVVRALDGRVSQPEVAVL